jgi:integrase
VPPLPLRSLREAACLRKELKAADLAGAVERLCTFFVERPRPWKPGTLYNSRLAYQQILKAVGNRPASSLTLDDTDRAMLAAWSGGYSADWIHFLRGRWRILVRFLIRARVLSQDISITWESVPKDPEDHERVYHDYTREEITRLCEFLRPPIARLCWIACYAGGLRRQNLIDLTWTKIPEDSSGRWLIVIPGREMKGRRELRWPVSAPLRAILGPRGLPREKVIPGLPTSSKILKALKRASRKAGMPEEWAYVHQFRRTCCSWLKEAGVTRDQAMTLFGWRNHDVLLNSYWPPVSDNERRAILDKMP